MSTPLTQPPSSSLRAGRPVTGHLTSGPVAGLVRRSPLGSFAVLSCFLSWLPAPLYVAGISPMLIASFGPLLAALTVLGVAEGRAGVKSLLRSMVRWRVPARAYVLAVGLPVLLSGTAVAAALALGAETPATSDLAAWSSIPLTALVVLLIPGLGGAWEEPGWRGFALPRLEKRLGALTGPLVLGLLWAVWHGPLFLAGQILWSDVLVIVAASVVFASVFHTARDSVLLAMVMHAMNNAVGGAYASQLFHGADLTLLGLLTAAAWWLAAGVVISRSRPASRALEG